MRILNVLKGIGMAAATIGGGLMVYRWGVKKNYRDDLELIKGVITSPGVVKTKIKMLASSKEEGNDQS